MRIALLLAYITIATPSFANDPACFAKLKVAGQIGLIKDMKATAAGMEFIVDEAVFSGMAFRSKEGLVEAINCGMLENGKQFNPIVFRSHRTNKIIGKHEWGKLIIP